MEEQKEKNSELWYRRANGEEISLKNASNVISKGQIQLIQDGQVIVSVDAVYDFSEIPEWAHSAVLEIIKKTGCNLALLSEKEIAERDAEYDEIRAQWERYSKSSWIKKFFWRLIYGRPLNLS